MQKMYVLQALGWGDREDAFYNIGVYSTMANAKNAEHNCISEAHDDGLTDVVTKIEEWELDA
jgi:hypothetical protein